MSTKTRRQKDEIKHRYDEIKPHDDEIEDEPQDEETQHDEVRDGEYIKRCYCQKCVDTYDKFCRKHKDDPHVRCQRRCFTVCEYKCESTQVIRKHWGHKKQFNGKWEHHRELPAPKHCRSCGHKGEACSCNKK